MNLISCQKCGIVVDKDRLEPPGDIYGEDGCIDNDKAIWINKQFLPSFSCPLCETMITYCDGNAH